MTYGEHAQSVGEGPCLRCVGKRVVGPMDEAGGPGAVLNMAQTRGTNGSLYTNVKTTKPPKSKPAKKG